MTELKEVTLTKKQAAELNKCIKILKQDDFSWQLKSCDFSDFERFVFARAAGFLSLSNVPFTAAYNAIRAFALLYWDKEKKSV